MKLLLIMPNFFDYPELIEKELEKLGYEVDFFDDRPSTNPFIKAIIRINKNLIYRYISNYFESIMQIIEKKQYDVVLLISGQSLSFSEAMMAKLRKTQIGARFYLYQWDSLINFPYIKNMYKYFDKCYSFDKDDVKNNEDLNFLPLFFNEKYGKIGEQRINNYLYDFCFIGTAHPKKYKFVKKISKQLEIKYPKQFIYYFLPSRIVYFYRKLKNIEFKNATIREFHFKPLNADEVINIYKNTKCVLDSAQDGQTGLTIRALEALGAKKKLITTNSDIKNYDFYKEENIYIYDGNIDFENKFFNSQYVQLNNNIYNKYSLKNWLETILKEDDYNENI